MLNNRKPFKPFLTPLKTTTTTTSNTSTNTLNISSTPNPTTTVVIDKDAVKKRKASLSDDENNEVITTNKKVKLDVTAKVNTTKPVVENKKNTEPPKGSAIKKNNKEFIKRRDFSVMAEITRIMCLW